MKILKAETEEQLQQIRTLFLEYAQSLHFELCFQNFDEELKHLPGEYVPPHGQLILAVEQDQAAGCVVLCRIDERTCEMKRLYVKPAFRHRGIGRALAVEIISMALSSGYECMRLDTIDTMGSALALYRSLGFKEIEPYRFNPIDGAVFMELDLHGE